MSLADILPPVTSATKDLPQSKLWTYSVAADLASIDLVAADLLQQRYWAAEFQLFFLVAAPSGVDLIKLILSIYFSLYRIHMINIYSLS